LSNIIEIKNIAKRYRIGENFSGFGFGVRTFRDIFNNKIKKITSGKKKSEKEVWALKDITFDVQEGEVIGIIGRNGAGKSTLLKILSRITSPTKGEARINGRVASLLEVGTGFNPELTGRENIYLNGSILGMKKKEIDVKFDEIVSFAEVEKFIDTPVKRYSSGMYMRLAFAVAAHIEPEILIVDEVLAVGDFEFQKKCLGKMSDVSKSGRTILFVSHNMGAVEQLCTRTIVLRNGETIFNGDTRDGINIYLRKSDRIQSNESVVDTTNYPDRDSLGNIARINRIRLLNSNGDLSNEFKMGEDIVIETETKFNETVKDPIFDFIIANSTGQYISLIRSDWEGYHKLNSNGIVKTKVILKTPPLTPGTYYISPEVIRTLNEGACLDIVHIPIGFKMLNNDLTGFGSYTNWDYNTTIHMHISSEWK
jgi:lipopolysaccharide transport system ATP-binding protein